MKPQTEKATNVATKDANASVPAPETGSDKKEAKKKEEPKDYSRIFVGKKPIQTYVDAISRNMDQPSLTLVTTASHAQAFFYIIENFCCFSGKIPEIKVSRDPIKKFFTIEAKLK